MIHRVALGSLERFIGILTEEFAGFPPTWIALVQAAVMNITDPQAEYVNELTHRLQNVDIRVKADLRNERIGSKIREHTLHCVPCMLVCGDKEVEAGKMAMRTRHGKDLDSMDVSGVIEKLQQETRSRSLQQLEEQGIKGGKRVQTARPDRINGGIRAPEVHSTGLEDETSGIVSLREALEKAEEAGVDLAEINPNAEPSICCIMNCGEFPYERSKSPKEQKKRQRVIQVKEIKFYPGTDDGGYQIKPRSLVRFLKDDDKVKITLCFRGREMVHQQIGMEALTHARDDLNELIVAESFPTKIEGHQMTTVLTPKRKR